MKKTLSVVLAIMVLLSMFTFLTSAVSVPEITMKVDKTTADVGDIITVKVSTSAKSKLCAMSADLKFDENKFEVVSATVEDSVSNASAIKAHKNMVRYALVTLGTISDDVTTLFTVKLKIKATGGKISLDLTEAYIEENGDVADVTVGAKAKLTPIEIKASSSQKPDTNTQAETCGNGHKADVMKEKVPATATTEGVGTISCVRCNKLLHTEVLPILGDEKNPVIPHTDAV